MAAEEPHAPILDEPLAELDRRLSAIQSALEPAVEPPAPSPPPPAFDPEPAGPSDVTTPPGLVDQLYALIDIHERLLSLTRALLAAHVTAANQAPAAPKPPLFEPPVSAMTEAVVDVHLPGPTS